jgi:tricorn protease
VLLRDPSLSRTHIAFSYAGSIWIDGRDGSGLRRLTTAGGQTNPVFSPDGLHIAFVGDVGGARAVFVVPATGGAPRAAGIVDGR